MWQKNAKKLAAAVKERAGTTFTRQPEVPFYFKVVAHPRAMQVTLRGAPERYLVSFAVTARARGAPEIGPVIDAASRPSPADKPRWLGNRDREAARLVAKRRYLALTLALRRYQHDALLPGPYQN